MNRLQAGILLFKKVDYMYDSGKSFKLFDDQIRKMDMVREAYTDALRETCRDAIKEKEPLEDVLLGNKPLNELRLNCARTLFHNTRTLETRSDSEGEAISEQIRYGTIERENRFSEITGLTAVGASSVSFFRGLAWVGLGMFTIGTLRGAEDPLVPEELYPLEFGIAGFIIARATTIKHVRKVANNLLKEQAEPLAGESLTKQSLISMMIEEEPVYGNYFKSMRRSAPLAYMGGLAGVGFGVAAA